MDEEAAAASIHGRAVGGTQINTAMRNGRLDYVNPVYELTIVLEITLGRVRYLVERGARVEGTGTLQVAPSFGRLNVIEYLFSKCAANVDGLEVLPSERLVAMGRKDQCH